MLAVSFFEHLRPIGTRRKNRLPYHRILATLVLVIFRNAVSMY